MKKKSSVLQYLLLLTGIILLVNILAYRYFFRFDFTADKRYTLSKATRDILRNIPEPVTVKAYFTKELPPQIEAARNDFRDMLIEYKSASKGMVQFAFIDPNEKPELEQEAVKEGIQPIIIDSREKDKTVQKKAYLGAVILSGDKKEVIPLVQPGVDMEYDLSTSIKKLLVKEKMPVAFIQGQHEPTLGEMGQVMESLSVLDDPEPVTLSDTADALDKYKTAVIVAPRDSFKQGQLQQLDRFLSRGGNLVIAMNRVSGDLENGSPEGTVVNTGLETWLKQKGLLVQDDFVIDTKCQKIGIQQKLGDFMVQSDVAFPYFPVITNFGNNPISKGLESVILPFASSMEFHGDSTAIRFIPLAMTSDKSGYKKAPVYFDINYHWQQYDFPLHGLIVAALMEGKLSGKKNSRMVVFGSGRFVVNGEQQQAVKLAPDNVNLLVNAVDYLSDQTGLMELRTKEITSRPLKELEDSQRTLWKYFNFAFPILVILAYGLFRSQRNRKIRIKRMEENYA